MCHPEILAPAGSMEALQAALRTGADAVYIGGKNYSARNSAENFSREELPQAAELCHKYGAKIYLAVNTLITDEESAGFCEYIKFTASIGVDAYIIQDWGVMHLIKKCVPDAVLHASTQMSVHTVEGARLLKEQGFSRIVPARELDRDAIEKICREDIETEIFVHGALCMSVSGQCYMSAMIGSRSANRGCCGQACRLPFSADNTPAHSLSLKDLSIIPQARELASIGVDSLKIEGRMKRPEYVASAVNELKASLEGLPPDMELLKGVFSRSGFTDGYYTGVRQDMFGIRKKEDVIAAPSFLPGIHKLCRNERQVHRVDFHAVVKPGTPLTVSASCGEVTVTVTDAPPQRAVNRPADIELLRTQLSRLGGTVFLCGDVTGDIDGTAAVSPGTLNRLRRELIEKLTNEIIRKNTPVYTITEYTPDPGSSAAHGRSPLPLRVFCRSREQADAAASAQALILPMELIDTDVIKAFGERLIVSPPRFISHEEMVISRLSELRELGAQRLMCHTPDSIAIGRKLGFRLHGSFSLNIMNSFGAEQMSALGLEDCVISPELKLSQINELHTILPIGAVVAGKLPVMLTRNCPIKDQTGCKRCRHHLTDRTGRSFPVICSGGYTEILNVDCLYMADRYSQMETLSFGEVMLADEDAAAVEDLLSGVRPNHTVTRGLFYRGV